MSRRVASPHPRLLLTAFQCELVVRCRVWEAGNPTKARFTHARAYAIDECKLPEMRAHHALIKDLLHLDEHLGALAMIQLDRLLVEHRIKIGIAAIRVGAALHHEGLEACRCIAERP